MPLLHTDIKTVSLEEKCLASAAVTAIALKRGLACGRIYSIFFIPVDTASVCVP